MGELFLSGNTILCYPVKVVWKQQVSQAFPFPAQAGFSVPKRQFKHAVDRNRLKRLLRESYRLKKAILYERLELAGCRIAVMILYIAKEELPLPKIDTALTKAMNRINEQLTFGD